MTGTDTYRKEEMLAQYALEQPGAYEALENARALLYGTPTGKLDKRTMALDLQSQVSSFVLEFQRQYFPWYGQLALVGEENVDFVLRSRMWSEEDKQELRRQKRKAYEIPILGPFWRKIEAEEISQRTEWNAEPRTPSSAPLVELQNHIFRMVAEQNKVHRVFSGVFRDAVVRNIGVSGVRLDESDPFGSIKIEQYRPQEFMWDVYSARDGSLKDANYLWRGALVDKTKFAREYPAFYDEILSSASTAVASMYEAYHTVMNPKVASRASSLMAGVELRDAMRMSNRFTYKREFYEKVFVEKYAVKDGYKLTEEYYDSADVAEKAMYDLMKRQADHGMQPRVSFPRPKAVTYVKRYVFCGMMLVDVETYQVDSFPYDFFIPEYYDGEITSFFQHLKDPQRLRNIMYSIQHQVIAGHKGHIAVNEAKLPQKDRGKKAEEKAALPSGYWGFNDNSGADIGHFFKVIHPPNQAPMAEALRNSVSGDIFQVLGGLNSIGITENAGESGRAINMRRTAATALLSGIFDQYSDYKQRVGEKVQYLTQFIDPNVPLKYAGESGDPVFMTIASALSDTDIDSIKEAQFDVKVSEVYASQTERDARMMQLMDFLRHMPEFAEDAAEIIFDYSGLSYTDKQRILTNRARRVDQQQQQIQAELSLKREETATKAWGIKMDKLIKAEEVAIQKQNMPKISASMKLPVTPAVVSTVLNHAGENTHPLGIAADQALNFELMQEQRNRQQKDFNENTPAWARKPQTKSGVQTPTDAAARTDREDYSD